MSEPLVQIDGMRALRRDLIKLDREEVPKALVAAGVAVAEPLVGRIRSALPTNDRPPPRGRHPGLASTVRAAKIRTGAAVRVGTKAVPYAGWVEFGGRRTRPHESYRPFQPEGRYIFPTARAAGPEAVRRYSEEVSRVFDRFVWSNRD